MTNNEKLIQNEFNPDWDAMAVMVEEQQRMAKRIEELEKREWQGLTVEEIAQGNKESWVTKQAWESAVWWAEEKLKEKNT